MTLKERIDALTELRLLAQDPLSYRRQVLALKAFFARYQSTVMALDDLTDTQGLTRIRSTAE